jgi:CRISPR/Cas system-associated protein Csx1
MQGGISQFKPKPTYGKYNFSYVKAMSRTYILQCCLYLVSQLFHNLLQYTEDVFLGFEDSKHIKRNEEVFSLRMSVSTHRMNFDETIPKSSVTKA